MLLRAIAIAIAIVLQIDEGHFSYLLGLKIRQNRTPSTSTNSFSIFLGFVRGEWDGMVRNESQLRIELLHVPVKSNIYNSTIHAIICIISSNRILFSNFECISSAGKIS